MRKQDKLVVERRSYDFSPHTHSHSFGQLIIPLQGELYIETEANQYEIDKYHLFFLPPEDEHTFFSQRTNEFLVMDMPVDLLSTVYLKRKEEFYFSLDNTWTGIKLLLLEEQKKGNLHNQSIRFLFNYICHLLFSDNVPPSIKYINQNFNKKIYIKKLAEIENYSINYYSEWFFNTTGMTVETYIQKLRLKRAKYLLKNSNLSIMQIALEVGYKYQSSLNTLFNKYEGKPPSYFRKSR